MKKRKGQVAPFDLSLMEVLPYFLIPVILNIFMVLFPIYNAVYYSFQHTYRYQLSFCGLDNYMRIFTDKIFFLSLRNNLLIIISTVFFQICPAFIICAIMSTGNLIVGRKFIQSIYFFPCLISPLVIGYIWKIMYSDQYGLINGILKVIGLGEYAPNWLGDPKIAMISVIIPLGWQFIGYYLVLLLAGVTGIEPEILEIAEIDGASGFKRTIYIILPLLKDTLTVCMIICISGGIKIFDQIFALTGGGPGYATSVLGQYAYSMSFAQSDYGYGSTISLMMFVIIIVGVLFAQKLLGGLKNE